ncbi:unnamed protein product [Sphagnum jensenii]|uniref:Uncharacterized protein n=1 Tax=Sphagnum jensenii TaxID=128206 RepID=A0ABP0X751_9BRYO
MSVVGFSELNVAYGHEDSLAISQLSILFCKIKNGTLNDNLQTAHFCPLCNLISYGTSSSSSSSSSLIQTLASITLLLWNFMQCI